MSERGQVLVVVAVLLVAGLMLLALAADGGRIYVEQVRLRRAAESSADAGIGWVSEQMVTLAVPRQTEAAARSACVPDGDYGDEGATCTATPEPEQIHHWLQDDDRATLVSPSFQATAVWVSESYAAQNDVVAGGPDAVQVYVQYPYLYDPEATVVQLRVELRRRTVVLLAGLLGEEFVWLNAVGLSQVPQR